MFITDEPIIVDDTVARARDTRNGALVTFEGVVRREDHGRRVTGIYYDCYRALAERELERIVEDVRTRFTVSVVDVRHRIGEVAAGETSLLVIVTAPHRKAAFDACQAVIDDIKKCVPIWKKERYADHRAKWLSPQDAPRKEA
ncbi:MAG: molybdenum cofactor biosynthesis protein MoaE [Candidatus Krumholzibacteria bacterium]